MNVMIFSILMNYNECHDFQIFFVGLHNELYMDMYNMKY